MRTHTIVTAAIALFSVSNIAFGQVNPSYNDRNYIVLPIDLVYFNAQNQNNEVLINWAFASTMVNAIELQKSVNARDFESIVGFQKGSASATNIYNFLDKMPFRNADNVVFSTVYYRLKQIDANHIFEYSKVIVVKEMNEIGRANAVPKSYQIVAKSTPKTQTFSIVNVAGQVMLNGQLKDSQAMDIRQLPAGFYCLNIEDIKIRFLKN
jgi:hypothetical protein